MPQNYTFRNGKMVHFVMYILSQLKTKWRTTTKVTTKEEKPRNSCPDTYSTCQKLKIKPAKKDPLHIE